MRGFNFHTELHCHSIALIGTISNGASQFSSALDESPESNLGKLDGKR